MVRCGKSLIRVCGMFKTKIQLRKEKKHLVLVQRSANNKESFNCLVVGLFDKNGRYFANV